MSEPSRLKRRQSSVSPRQPTIKRQRKQTERFELNEVRPSTARKRPRSEVKEVVYDRGTFLAIRAEGGVFYLCQAAQNVYDHHTTFKIRWLEIDIPPSTYKMAYGEKVGLETTICAVRLWRSGKGQYILDEEENARIVALLKAAEQGKDISKVDVSLFSPQTKKKRVERTPKVKVTPTTDKMKSSETNKVVPKKVKRSSSFGKRSPVKQSPPSKRSPVKQVSPGKKSSEATGLQKTASELKLKKSRSLHKKNSVTKQQASLAKKTSLSKKPSLQKAASLKKAAMKKRKQKERVKGETKLQGPKKKKGKSAKHDKKDPNRHLIPQKGITVWEKEPLTETRIPVPFVSTSTHSYLVHRAVNLQDYKLMEELIADDQHIARLDKERSLNQFETPLHTAIRNEDHRAIGLLAEQMYREYTERKPRAPPTRCLLIAEGTGRYNPRSLGIKRIRKVHLSRGSKEGNNAFVKDFENKQGDTMHEDYIMYACQHNISYKTLSFLVLNKVIKEDQIHCSVHHAVQAGHRKLALQMMENAMKQTQVGFNNYHKDALKFNGKENWEQPLREASIKKKSAECKNLLPLHCAAINPHAKYLEKLLTVAPEYNIEDADKRRPIHYAAACEGVGPLELLISKGVTVDEGDKHGLTPLIIACQTGRAHNVEVLLRHAKGLMEAQGVDGQLMVNKFGIGGVNRPLKTSWCPIHFAIVNGHKTLQLAQSVNNQHAEALNVPGTSTTTQTALARLVSTSTSVSTQQPHQDVINVLLKYGANINKSLNATCERLTPLMLACQGGDLSLVKLLINNHAKIRMTDKFQRTALIHAVQDGNAHIVSYLLAKGVDPNEADSSGNTALHYAVAYGWYFCMQVLLNAGAVPDPRNDWKMTPLAISYLKGHLGLTKILLDIPGVNINIQDEKGCTLLMNVISTQPLTNEVAEQVEMLVKDKGSDINITNKQGQNCFLILIAKAIPRVSPHPMGSSTTWPKQSATKVEEEKKKRKEAQEVAVKIAKLLFDHDMDTSWVSSDGHTLLMQAIVTNMHKDNPDICRMIVDKTKLIPVNRLKDSGNNLLHLLVQTSPIKGGKEYLSFLEYMADMDVQDNKKGIDVLKELARLRNRNHETPFMILCREYARACQIWKSNNYADEVDSCKLGQKIIQFFMEKLESELEYSYEITVNNKLEKCVKSAIPILLENTSEPEEDGKRCPTFHYLLKYNPDLEVACVDGKSTLLMKYISQGNVDLVQLLLNAGCRVNYHEITNTGGQTPYLKAISLCQSRTLVPMLECLEKAGADVTATNSISGDTALHLLVGRAYEKEEYGRCSGFRGSTDMQPVAIQVIKKMIDSPGSCDLDRQNNYGLTALHLLADTSSDSPDESKELDQLLIRKGANLFLQDKYKRLPLHYLFNKLDGSGNKSCDPVESFSIYASGMKYEQLDTADNVGCTPLICAASRGATVCCMLLVQKGANINQKDIHGNTALSLAVSNKHESCALTLMQKGANINCDIITNPAWIHTPSPTEDMDSKEDEEDSGSLPYFLCDSEEEEKEEEEEERDEAWRKRQQALLKVMQEVGSKLMWKFHPRHFADPPKPVQRGHPIFQGIVENGWQGLTYIAMDLLEPFGMDYASAVEIAIRIQKYRFALTLMNKQMDGSKLRVNNRKGQTLLHCLCETCNDSPPANTLMLQKEIADDLVKERGVSINMQDQYGCTALQYAVLHHHFDLANHLLEFPDGCDVNLQDKYGRSVLAALLWEPSASKQAIELLDTLVEHHKARVDDTFCFPPIDLFRRMHRLNPKWKEDLSLLQYKTTPLIYALCLQQYRIMTQLLKHKASPNQPDQDGVTPLMYAARLNDVTAVKILISDPEVFDLSAYQQNERKIKELIRKGFIRQVEPTDDNPMAADTDMARILQEHSLCDYSSVTSKVTASGLDKHGWSVLHHMASSLPTGAYENLELLQLLVAAGAPLDVTDKQGMTPVHHALRRGASTLARAMQHLAKVARRSWVSPSLREIQFEDGIQWRHPPNIDVKADAAAMLAKMEATDAATEDHQPVPDQRAQLNKAEVVFDKKLEVPYDVLLTKVDVRLGDYGMYNFYKMQVLLDKEKDLPILFTCWGRIGDSGQYQRTPYSSMDEACAEFAKIFLAKSGNDWSNIKSFKVQPKKYRLVEADYRRVNKIPDVHFDLESDLPSDLPAYVQGMMKQLSSVSMLKSMTRRTGISIPFGKLKRENLMKAMDFLKQLLPLAQEKRKLQSKLTVENLDEYRKKLEKISELTSEFYYLVPQSGYSYEKLTALEEERDIHRQMEHIQNLLELHYAGQILLGAQYQAKEINPVDYVYQALNTKIKLMKETDPMVKLIMLYMSRTGESYNVEGIYQLSVQGEADRLSSLDLENHKLLWHGSRTSNLISILSQGLLIAPKEAPSTGYAFGKGIYTADTFCKSAGYCCNDGGGWVKYMLLCEVALGKSKHYNTSTYMEAAPPGYDSALADGTDIPDPKFDVRLPTGVVIPLGKIVSNSYPNATKENHDLQADCRFGTYNEYIVYKEEQVALRYIVQFR